MIELQTGKAGDKLICWSPLNEGIVHLCFLVDNVQKEFARIKGFGYSNFKIKNGEEIYKVEDGYIFKIIAPEGTEIEMRDTQIYSE
jgi:glyoxylase I family protein